MNKDVYKAAFYPPLIPNTKYNTIFEFNNIMIEVQNRFTKDIYSRINCDIKYYNVDGKLFMDNLDNKFRQIKSFNTDNVVIEKYTLSSNLEIKDNCMLLYCGDIALKIDNDIYDSDTFHYIMIYRNLSVGKNAYVITLPKNKNDYPFERISITIDATNESVIDFSDIKWLVKNSTYMDSDFMDIYNKLILERI